MKKTFGEMPTTMPAGYFKAVSWPVLAMMDKKTGDGRLLDSAGGGVRNLPATGLGKFATSYGHEGAVVTSAVFEVTFDTDTGIVSGRGFMLNDPNGRMHARMIATKAMDRNSVDLADLKARFEEDLDTGEYWVRFTQWNIAATTGVSTPAFAEAYAELIDSMSEEELTAALIGDDPMEELVADCPVEYRIVGAPVESPTEAELTASGAVLAPYDAFFMPEADKPTKIVVTADRRVYGHLAVWDTCHDGIDGLCVIPPRPRDGYASFNQNGPLTEKGQVQTGPIFALGGHRSIKGAKTVADAYGGVENAWADVRVTQGRFGPWLSGVVDPKVAELDLYRLRASRISGHWLADRLKAIVSVNVEAYPVEDRTQIEQDLIAGFAYSISDEGISELVASFPSCLDAPDDGSHQLTLHLNVASLSPEDIASAVREALGEEEDETVTAAPTEARDGDALLAALLLEEADL